MEPEQKLNASRRYAVFLSYRHADNKEAGRQWATWLHHLLEGYEIPEGLVGKKNSKGDLIPASLYPVFRDEEELSAGTDLTQPIREALENSELLVVLCSPRAVESSYVADEIRYFKELGKSNHILALMIDGEPNAADDSGKAKLGIEPDAECLPEPLRYGVAGDDGKIDWSQRTKPIAADVRPDGSAEQGWTTGAAYHEALQKRGKLREKEIAQKVHTYEQQLELAKLKIVAGSLGVPLRELTQRDKAMQLRKAKERARTLKLWLATVGMLAILAVAGGVIAFVKQGEAQSALKEQKRLSFEAVVRNAESDDTKGESAKIIAELKPYLSEAELAQHPMHAEAVKLDEKARDGYKRLSAFAEQVRKGEQSVTLDLGNGVMLDMVLIPAGTFTMGAPENEKDLSITMASPEDEKERSVDEKQHEVTITRPFYMGKFHITQEQYEAVTGLNPSYFRGKPKNPVEQVTWFYAVAFCEKLEKQSGAAKVHLSLPTEAQWEYACRGGTQTRFYFGDDEGELEQYAWYEKNAGPGTAGYGTHPVGEKNQPNKYGLYDIHGNVFDWCQDWYDANYYSRSPSDDPAGPINGEIVKSINSAARVMRGGSWSHLAEYCRSAHRDYDAPDDSYSDLGFRIVDVVRP